MEMEGINKNKQENTKKSTETKKRKKKEDELPFVLMRPLCIAIADQNTWTLHLPSGTL